MDAAETAVEQDTKRHPFLSPVERISEVLFGLIMTLSITGTMSVVSGGREEVGTTLLAVLGCNLAWGIIDGILYLLNAIAERARGYRLYEVIIKSKNTAEADQIVEEALPPKIAELLTPEEIGSIRRRLADLPDKGRGRLITRDDVGGTIGVFIFVVLSCLPVIFPFVLIQDPWRALRVSNAIAITMLFIGGYFLAKYAGLAKVITGIVMVVLGGAMVGLTIALGG